jgi:hypothetical protein
MTPYWWLWYNFTWLFCRRQRCDIQALRFRGGGSSTVITLVSALSSNINWGPRIRPDTIRIAWTTAGAENLIVIERRSLAALIYCAYPIRQLSSTETVNSFSLVNINHSGHSLTTHHHHVEPHMQCDVRWNEEYVYRPSLSMRRILTHSSYLRSAHSRKSDLPFTGSYNCWRMLCCCYHTFTLPHMDACASLYQAIWATTVSYWLNVHAWVNMTNVLNPQHHTNPLHGPSLCYCILLIVLVLLACHILSGYKRLLWGFHDRILLRSSVPLYRAQLARAKEVLQRRTTKKLGLATHMDEKMLLWR